MTLFRRNKVVEITPSPDYVRPKMALDAPPDGPPLIEQAIERLRLRGGVVIEVAGKYHDVRVELQRGTAGIEWPVLRLEDVELLLKADKVR